MISDDSLDAWDDQGPPICFNNREIRKMLELAHAGKDDVFYDLGSGWGHNLIIALTEFDVKKAVGIEDDRERYHVSVNRMKKWKIPKDRWAIVPGRFEDVLANKVPQASPREASIVFYGRSTDESTLNGIARNLSSGDDSLTITTVSFQKSCQSKTIFPSTSQLHRSEDRPLNWNGSEQ